MTSRSKQNFLPAILELASADLDEAARTQVLADIDYTIVLLEIPPNCVGLLNVAENAYNLLNAHPELFDAGRGVVASRLVSALQRLLGAKNTIVADHPQSYIAGEIRNARLRGNYGERPLYCFLYHGTTIVANVDRFALFQAQMFRAYTVIYSSVSPPDRHVFKDTFRAGRALGEDKYKGIVQMLPSEETNPLAYARCILRLQHEHIHDDPLYRQLCKISRLLDHAAQGNTIEVLNRNLEPNGHRQHDYHAIRGVRPYFDPTSTVTIFSDVPLTINEGAAPLLHQGLPLQRLGLDRRDAGASITTIRARSTPQSPHYSVLSYVIACRHGHAAVARSNAALPWSRTVIDDECLVMLLATLERTSRDDNEDALIALAVGLTLFTGQPIERWISLRVEPTTPARKSNNLDASIFLDTSSVRIKSTLVDDGAKPTSRNKSQAISTTDTISFPLIGAIVRLTRRVHAASGANPYTHDTSTEKLQRRAQQFVRRATRSSTVKCSLAQITNWLPQVITHHPAYDATTATLLVGRFIEHSTCARYYTAVDTAHLALFYRETIAREFQRIGAASPDWSDSLRQCDSSAASSQATAIAIGSKVVPTREHHASAIAKLQSDIRLQRRPESLEEVVRRHTTITLYVSRMLAFATGYRAINLPFPTLLSLDRERQFGVVSDKDGSNFSDARLVWLPGFVSDQIDYYLSYLVRLADQLRVWIPNLASDIEARVAPRKEYASRRAWYAHQSDLIPFLFFLAADGRLIERLTVSAVAAALRPYTDLPLNANRHYMASMLRAAGAPAWAINFVLGHWKYGMAPGHMTSTFSPVMFSQVMKTYLEPLMIADGWRALKF